MKATRPEVDSTVRTNCANEIAPITSPVNKLARRLDGFLANKDVSLTILIKLKTSVAKFMAHLECNKKQSDDPVESSIQRNCIPQNNVNSLLESKQEDPNKKSPTPREQPYSSGIWNVS